jgi:hypothetical protein
VGLAKKVGIGIGIAVGAFFALVIVVGLMVGVPPSSSEVQKIMENPEAQAVATPAHQTPRFTDSNVATLYASPNFYKGALVDITGKVFLAPDRDGSRTGFQMWQAGKTDFDRNTLVYSDRHDLTTYASGDCVRVVGKNIGTLSGENAFGATLNLPAIEASDVSMADCETVVYPPIKEIASGESKFSNGITVTLDKVVFAEEHTRVYLTIANGQAEKIYFMSTSAKAFQGNKQFETAYAFDADFPDIEYEIYPAIEETGVIIFEPLSPETPGARFHFEIMAGTFLNDYSFDFTL